MEDQSIHSLVRKMEKDFTVGKTTTSKYVEFSLYLTINKILAYSSSTHVNGRTDSLGRIKPFFDIGTSAANVWFRATDIDRKHINLKAKNDKQEGLVFCAKALQQDYMKKQNFGVFLNDWGRVLSRFGSAVVKFTEKGDKLHINVIPWSRLICDSIDFENNPVIEKLWFTPAQLRKNKSYNQEFVKKLIASVGPRQTMDNVNKDNKSEHIPVYEIHGELPLSLLKKSKGQKVLEGDDEIFVQQAHVVSFVAKKDSDGNDIFDEYTLFSGKEEKSPYMLTHLIKEDDRVLGIGAIEHTFEAQWMTNHTAKQIKDYLDLASKLIFQTSDGNYVGQNVLKNIQSGDILKHAKGESLSRVDNTAADTASLRAYMSQWQMLPKDITSTPDAQRGETMPSGTAYRQVALLQQQSGSLFEVMRQNKGLDLEVMLRERIIPHLKKKMDTSEEITAIFEDYDIAKLDARYVPNEAIRRTNKKMINKIMAGELPMPGEYEQDMASQEMKIKEELGIQGNQRFFKPSDISTKTWKEALEDFEWKVEVEITPENVDKQAVYETLNSLFQTIANPNTAMVLQTPEGKALFNKILSETGKVSPLEFNLPARPMAMPAMPSAPAIR